MDASSWWKSRNELDEQQEKIIMLPVDGRYVISGPPGCGKTNLLVLRAAYLNRMGFKNLTILSFGTSLSDFIRTGIKGKGLESEQVDTHVRWGRAIAVGHDPDCRDRIDGIGDLAAKRRAIATACKAAIAEHPDAARRLQAVLVDEAQDLYAEELDVVVGSSARIMLAGDTKQRVYRGGSALAHAVKLGFEEHRLTAHYRIGHAIAKVADKIFEPADPGDLLLANCNYDETKLQSSAEHLALDSREQQFDRMCAKLRTQLKAYPREMIGILVAQNKSIDDLRAKFADHPLQPEVVYHDENGTFMDDGRIHVMTIASSKGTEFRAVHLYAAEEVANIQDTQQFWYTAVTRAKTSLTAYSSPGDRNLSRFLLAGFAESGLPSIDELFEEQ